MMVSSSKPTMARSSAKAAVSPMIGVPRSSSDSVTVGTTAAVAGTTTAVPSKSLTGGHRQWVTAVAFSPDGSLLATGSGDSTVKLWDVHTATEVCTLADHNYVVHALAFALQQPYLVTGSGDCTAKLWDLHTNSPVQNFVGHSDWILAVAISKDADHVVTGSKDTTAKLWSSQTGKDLRTFQGHVRPVQSVALSATDSCFVATGSADGTARLWSFQTGAEIRRFRGHRGGVNAVVFSSNDQYLATGSDDCHAKLWSVTEGIKIQTFKGHKGIVSSLAMSRDGDHLFTGSSDATVKLWTTSGCPRAIKTWKNTTDKGILLLHPPPPLPSNDDRRTSSENSDDIAKYGTTASSTHSGHPFREEQSSTTGINAAKLLSNMKKGLAVQSEVGKKWMKIIKHRATNRVQVEDNVVRDPGKVLSIALSADASTIAIGLEEHNSAKLWHLTQKDFEPSPPLPQEVVLNQESLLNTKPKKPSSPIEIPWNPKYKVTSSGLQKSSTATSMSTPSPSLKTTAGGGTSKATESLGKFITSTNEKEPDIDIRIPEIASSSSSEDTISTGIMKGRLCLSEILCKPDAEPLVFPEDYLMHCTNNFSSDRKLGVGGYGTVYRAKDSTYNHEFVVKCPQLDLREEEDVVHVQDSFRREIATLKRCHHPNIVRLYGYCLDSQVRGRNYLVFEFLPGGSLDSFFRSDVARSCLSGHRRLQIMYEVARSLNFLHKGGASGYEFYHRDVKASNICLDSNYTAKLIDCGLAKFVQDPVVTKNNPSVGRTLLQSSGQLVFGTPGYICPWYNKGTKKFIPACDVYSFGITMLELLTGCLQEGQSGDRDLGDLAEKYEKTPTSLKEDDIDPILHNELDDIVDQISELALRCIQSWPEQRPSTSELIDDLAKMLSQMEGRDPNSWEDTTSKENADEALLKSATCSCCLCASVAQGGVLCSCGHYIDRTCLEQYIVKHIKNSPGYSIPCAIDGCKSKYLSNNDIYGKVSVSTFKLLTDIQKGNVNPSPDVAIWEPQMLTLLQQINEGVSRLDQQLGRHTKALARLSAGIQSPCPRLIWMIPIGGQHNWRTWRPATITHKRIELYFVCQHSYTVIQPPLKLQVTQEWVKCVAPALKVGVLLLQLAIVAGKLVVGLPFPQVSVLGCDVNSQVEAFDNFVSEYIDDDDISRLGDVGRALSRGLPADEVVLDKVTQLTGEAYEALAKEANKDENSKWKAQVSEVLDHSGSQIYVKREYAAKYS